MALSRWSHSRWYIYESGDDQLTICMDGSTTLKELNDNFEEVLNRISAESSPFEKAELKFYLKSWQDFGNNKIDKENYNNRIKKIRAYSYRKSYLENGDKTYIDELKTINPHEVFRIIERKEKQDTEVAKTLKIENLDKIPVKITSASLHHGLWRVKMCFEDSTGEIIELEENIFDKDLLYPEFPILIDETYFFNKKSNFLENRAVSHRIEEIKSFVKDKIKELESIYLKL